MRPRARWVASVLLLVLVVAGCSAAPPRSTVPPPPEASAGQGDTGSGLVDAIPRLLLITAMPSEIGPLLDRAEVERTVAINGRRHYLGRLAGVDVVMVAAGISMVNAALGTQQAIDRFRVRGIVFSGIAGGTNPDIDIADVTVPAQWSEYQEHVFTDASRRGWRRGWRNPDLGNFGIMHPQRVRVVSPAGEVDEESLRLWFPVDAEMLDAARAVSAEALSLERCNDEGYCVDGEPGVVIGGNGVSGPTFVDDRGYREFVWSTFSADALDMETAAVGHVAWVNGLPYIGVRSISDSAGADPHRNEVTTWGTLAARNAAAFVEAFLGVWAERGGQ